MDTRSRHLLVEYHGCDVDILNHVEGIEALMKRAALAAQTTVVQSVFHRFSPQGVSGVVVIEESHLSIHTWPEYGYAAVDFFTCGEGIPESAHEVLREGLGAQRSEVMKVERGLPLSHGPGMKVARHWVEEESAEAPAAQAPC